MLVHRSVWTIGIHWIESVGFKCAKECQLPILKTEPVKIMVVTAVWPRKIDGHLGSSYCNVWTMHRHLRFINYRNGIYIYHEVI